MGAQQEHGHDDVPDAEHRGGDPEADQSGAVALTDRPLAINVRIAQEQPDAPHVLRGILDERDPAVRRQLTVLTTSGGHPRMYGMNGDFRDSGMLHFHAASTVAHARTAEREGMDAVIATGYEAAGHAGHVPVHTFVLVPSVAAAVDLPVHTFVLVPSVAAAVDLPVLCAGGVVDAGALALGAEMGYIGSRVLASEWCEYHRRQKEYIVGADETQTEVVPAFFGPARNVSNAFTAEIRRLAAEDDPPLERMRVEGAAMRRGALEGDHETGMLIGGQGIGRIDAVLPAERSSAASPPRRERRSSTSTRSADRGTGGRARSQAWALVPAGE